MTPQDSRHRAAEVLTFRGFNGRGMDSSVHNGTLAKHMQLGPGRLKASVELVRFNRIGFRLASVSSTLRASVQPPVGTITIGFALEAPEPFLINGERVHGGALTLFAGGRFSDVVYPSGSRGVTVPVPEDLYAREIGVATTSEYLRFPLGTPVLVPTPPALARLRDVVAAMEEMTLREATLIADGQWQSNAQSALLDAFVGAIASSRLTDDGAAGRLHSARSIVLAAESGMAADMMTLPTISTLCVSLGVSRRTLERAFQDILGVSPGQYLRVRALNAVRQYLLRGDHEPGIITRAAIDNGFWHLGRFSASYRALFGERPIDTVRTAAPH